MPMRAKPRNNLKGHYQEKKKKTDKLQCDYRLNIKARK